MSYPSSTTMFSNLKLQFFQLLWVSVKKTHRVRRIAINYIFKICFKRLWLDRSLIFFFFYNFTMFTKTLELPSHSLGIFGNKNIWKFNRAENISKFGKFNTLKKRETFWISARMNLKKTLSIFINDGCNVEEGCLSYYYY